jgi:adenine phosphoribosyltransferase
LHIDAIKPYEKVLIIDDLLATGGTTKATIDLVKKLQGSVVECGFLIQLSGLNGGKKLKNEKIFSILKY